MASSPDDQLGPFQSFLRRHGLRHHYVKHRRRFSSDNYIQDQQPSQAPEIVEADPQHTSCLIGRAVRRLSHDPTYIPQAASGPKAEREEVVAEYRARISYEDRRAARRVRRINSSIRRAEFQAQRLRLRIRQCQRDTFEEIVGYVDEYSDHYEKKIRKANARVKRLERRWTRWEGRARRRDRKIRSKQRKAVRVRVRHNKKLVNLETSIINATRQAQVGVERKATLRKEKRITDLRVEAAGLFKALYNQHYEQRKRKNEIKAGVLPCSVPKEPVNPSNLNKALEAYIEEGGNLPHPSQYLHQKKKSVSFNLGAVEHSLPDILKEGPKELDLATPSFRRRSEGSDLYRPPPRRKSRRLSVGSILDNAARHVTQVVESSLPAGQAEGLSGIVENLAEEVDPTSEIPQLPPLFGVETPSEAPKIGIGNEKTTTSAENKAPTKSIEEEVAEVIEGKVTEVVERALDRRLSLPGAQPNIQTLPLDVAKGLIKLPPQTESIIHIPSVADAPSSTVQNTLAKTVEQLKRQSLVVLSEKPPIKVLTKSTSLEDAALTEPVTICSTTTWLASTTALDRPAITFINTKAAEAEGLRLAQRVQSILSHGTFGPSLPKSKSFRKSKSDLDLSHRRRSNPSRSSSRSKPSGPAASHTEDDQNHQLEVEEIPIDSSSIREQISKLEFPKNLQAEDSVDSASIISTDSPLSFTESEVNELLNSSPLVSPRTSVAFRGTDPANEVSEALKALDLAERFKGSPGSSGHPGITKKPSIHLLQTGRRGSWVLKW